MSAPPRSSFVFDAGLFELGLHLCDVLERHVGHQRHPRRRAGPLRDHENEACRGEADDDHHGSSRSADTVEDRCEKSQASSTQVMFTTVLYASISLFRSSTSISSEIDASSAAAMTWWSSTGSPRTKRWT